MSAYLPAMRWNPLVQTSDSTFGVRAAQFGFTITRAATESSWWKPARIWRSLPISAAHQHARRRLLLFQRSAMDESAQESSGRSNPFRRGDAWRWEDIFGAASVQWLCVQIFSERDLIELNVKRQSRPQAHSGSDRHFRYHALERGYWGRREGIASSQ
jgi:hypothetical protein